MYEIKQIKAGNITILKVTLPYLEICVFKIFYYKNNFQVTSYTIDLRNFIFSIVTAIAYFS